MDIKSELILNQFRAAPYAYDVLRNEFRTRPDVLSLMGEWFAGKDVCSLGRDLCLPVAACTAVNWLRGEKRIGDASGAFRVGDFFRTMLPFHTTGPTGLPAPYDQGWRVFDAAGNVYHHAVIAFMKIFGIHAYSVRNFPSAQWAFRQFPDALIVFAVSLSNSFVSAEYPGHTFEDGGRHVVDIMAVEGGRFTIAESYQEIQEGQRPYLINKDIGAVDGYLVYKDGRPSQGIIFSLDNLIIPQEYQKDIYIPETVSGALGAMGKV